jgi:hypothetical protein
MQANRPQRDSAGSLLFHSAKAKPFAAIFLWVLLHRLGFSLRLAPAATARTQINDPAAQDGRFPQESLTPARFPLRLAAAKFFAPSIANLRFQ